MLSSKTHVGEGKIVATLSIGMVMVMGCATSSAREGDPGWEVDAGMSEGDANVVTPSLRADIPIQCPGGYASTYPPGSACIGSGVRAHCSGVRGTGYPTFCAGPCVIAPTSTPEVCDGIDNDCDGLLNENPGELCDDGRGCTSDSCLGALGCANSAGLSTCQEIRRPIAESRIAPDGASGQCLPGAANAGDTVGAPNLLMNPGQVPPSFVNITPNQCARARCTTARWLERFDPSAAATARRVAVCAE